MLHVLLDLPLRLDVEWFDLALLLHPSVVLPLPRVLIVRQCAMDLRCGSHFREGLFLCITVDSHLPLYFLPAIRAHPSLYN